MLAKAVTLDTSLFDPAPAALAASRLARVRVLGLDPVAEGARRSSPPVRQSPIRQSPIRSGWQRRYAVPDAVRVARYSWQGRHAEPDAERQQVLRVQATRAARPSRKSWQGLQVNGLGLLELSDALPPPLHPRVWDQRRGLSAQRLLRPGRDFGPSDAERVASNFSVGAIAVGLRKWSARAQLRLSTSGGSIGAEADEIRSHLHVERRSRSERDSSGSGGGGLPYFPVHSKSALRLLAQLEEERLDELLDSAVGNDAGSHAGSQPHSQRLSARFNGVGFRGGRRSSEHSSERVKSNLGPRESH
ncbi:hypothetical protein T492DRAFT_958475 [Pavlovales sp. CCMP2436]|nr:hypothetical protein T492DRAFT_958475 [Pavlovales sp. CCMP2436]